MNNIPPLLSGQLPSRCVSYAQDIMPNCRNAFFAAEPRWGAFGATPDPLTGFKGPTSGGGQWRRGELRGGKGKKESGRRKGREGKRSYRYFFSPTSSPDLMSAVFVLRESPCPRGIILLVLERQRSSGKFTGTALVCLVCRVT